MVLIEATAGTGKTTARGDDPRVRSKRGTACAWRGADREGGGGARGRRRDPSAHDRLAASSEVERGGTLSDDGRYKVLMLDEGGMADTRQFAWLLEQAEREGMKVIVFGDSNQLTSVAPGGWLGYFHARGSGRRCGWIEIVRQRDAQHRKAVSDLSRGRPERVDQVPE